ncbi:hypothetical protein LDG_5613 [Legionella drancourtii LLAP12]|uniref:Uncharacterized protein n=1 Tax=Legionella drancourtii LLAP12 TaxID=658187 RepID=G9EK89_9GAMM|nr:hypothetical protein LDG_5613 [Legionella drancourtii LLAP12]
MAAFGVLLNPHRTHMSVFEKQFNNFILKFNKLNVFFIA